MDNEFEQLYNTYYMQVYSYVMSLAKNQHDAEEIAQKTFFKAMATGKKHTGSSSEFTWLCAIAKNLFVDELRAYQRTSEYNEEHISDIDIERAIVNKDSTFQIHLLLHDMDEPYKEVFQLRVFGELPFKKIGLLFGKTENWARVTYHRARLRIQERMEKE